MKSKSRQLPGSERAELLQKLKKRFEKNKARHKDVEWTDVETRLEANPDKLWSLNEMEISGGEPDVVEYDKKNNTYTFYDCSDESPKGRRSICYDHQALESRKEHKPENSAIQMASDMGIDILTEEQYRTLQQLGKFDLKTSSWVFTPPAIRTLGGAIFCDRRYEHIFVYHNGAESYYGARGFRGALKV